MKFLVVLAVAVACASADVPYAYKDEANAAIVKAAYDIRPEGSYEYAYETANGIAAQANGVVKPGEYPALEVTGGYRYISPDGSPAELTYVANEFGYQPKSNLLPVGPAIPEAIVRSLQYIAAHPAPTQVASANYQPAQKFGVPSAVLATVG